MKQVITLLAAVGFTMLLLGCREEDAPVGNTNTLSELSIAPSGDTLYVIGDSLQFTASGMDVSGNEVPIESVTWSSSDETVLSVSPTGMATALAVGTVTLTATTEEDITDEVVVRVDIPEITEAPFNLDIVLRVLPFGIPLNEALLNPTYEYITVGDGATVYAVLPGIVKDMRYQPETDDYELDLQYAPVWKVFYDHVSDLTVSIGDTVNAGDPLGAIAFYSDSYEGGPEPIRLGRVEIQFGFEGEDGVYEAICPALYATDAFNNAHKAMLTRISSNETQMCVEDRFFLL